MRKNKPKILVEEYSPPPTESDSEPDSEAVMRRRTREGFPFPEGVALLEKFLKEAEEKIEEIHELYSVPGKVLTMEEISTLDRKLLGIAAIRRRVGEKMKKLEEDCWKEMEEVLDGRGAENDRNEKKLSFLLAIIKPSCDLSALINFLKMNDFPFKIDSTFEDLHPFAKTYTIKQEETTEVQKEETDNNVNGNILQVSSEESQAKDPPRVVKHKETVQPMVPRGNVEQKRLERKKNKVTDDSEVKKEVKEEEDLEMGEEGGKAAKDQPARVEKEPSKRKARKDTGRKRAFGDKVQEQTNEKPPEAIVKEEEVDGGYEEGAVPTQEPAEIKKNADGVAFRKGEEEATPPEAIVKEEEVDGSYEEGAVPTQEPAEMETDADSSQEPQMDDDGGAFCKGGVNFHSHPKPKRRKLEISEEIDSNESDFHPNEADLDSLHDYDEMNDGLNQIGLVEEEGEAEGGRNSFDSDDTNGLLEKVGFFQKPVNRKISGKSHAEEVNDADESDGEERAIREKFGKPVRWSDRLAKPIMPVMYTVKKDSDDESSEEGGQGDSERDQEEEEHRERLDRSRKISSGDEAQDDGQEDEKVDQAMDKDDSMDNVNGEKMCPVDACSEKLPSSEELVEHMKNHPVPVKCGVCRRRWSKRSKMREHYKTHTGEKPFKCEICKIPFSQRDHLRIHERKHTGERPYKCYTCQKTFAHSQTLKIHHRTHTGERPYECDVCDFKSAQLYNLKRHQRSHTGERPYLCTLCQKGFRRSSDLAVHMRSHTGERPYECDKCDFKTAHSSSLNIHKRMHTEERLYECDVCEFKTTTLRRFTEHKRNHTGEKPFPALSANTRQ